MVVFFFVLCLVTLVLQSDVRVGSSTFSYEYTENVAQFFRVFQLLSPVACLQKKCILRGFALTIQEDSQLDYVWRSRSGYPTLQYA